MFNVNDYVMYGTTGVCKIAELKTAELVRGAARQYYYLKPLKNESSTIYAPTDTHDSRMRSLVSREEIDDILKNAAANPLEWIDSDNRRKEEYTKLLRTVDVLELVRLVRLLEAKRHTQEEAAKKFHVADELLLRQASALLCEELGCVLELNDSEIMRLIMK